jgi:hypothetical protein
MQPFGGLAELNKKTTQLVHLLPNKCIPVLLFVPEAFFSTKTDVNAGDLTINRFLVKLFKSVNVNRLKVCRV